MGAGDLLRRLDQMLLPPLARGLARLGRGQVRLRLVTCAAVLSAVAVLVAAVWAVGHRPADDPTLGGVVRVGVVEGESIPSYVQASRQELDALLTPAGGGAREETYALITLGEYLPPEGLTPILGGVAVAEVFGHVPLPDTRTSIERIAAFRIPDDIVAGMDKVAGRKEQEARDYQRLAEKLIGGDEDERRLRAMYTGGARLAAAEAAAYRSRCACVYAAVVRATPTSLEQIADRAEVRAVDPAPEVRRLDRAVFMPPLPEQTGVVAPTMNGTRQNLPDEPVTGPSPVPSAPPTGPGVTTSPSGPGQVAPDAAPTATPSPEVSPSPGVKEKCRGRKCGG